MGIPRLRYQNEMWDVNLPSILAYTFKKEDIDLFIRGNSIPLDFDTNLTERCNANCKYCATQGGKLDVRFNYDNSLPKLTDEHISEIIKQLNLLGTKTFFLCSNGEPLLNPKRFLDILDKAGDKEINIITYTNGITLNKNILKELYKRKVNLVIKLESLNPRKNDEIIFGKNEPKNKSYNYYSFNNQKVPRGIIEAFEVYGSDSNCLGIETIILKDNIDEIIDIRNWVYDLGSSQFLKHLYPLGYVKISREEVMPDNKKEKDLVQKIIAFDSKYGFIYPSFQTPDHYSYDSRRFMNNCVNIYGFPFRMFAHEFGGIYQSSQIVTKNFGFGTERIISLFDSKGNINMKEYFNKIEEQIKNE
ncbi:MAG: radical SAM protein [Candidatus Pacearchaeota archaeon]